MHKNVMQRSKVQSAPFRIKCFDVLEIDVISFGHMLDKNQRNHINNWIQNDPFYFKTTIKPKKCLNISMQKRVYDAKRFIYNEQKFDLQISGDSI